MPACKSDSARAFWSVPDGFVAAAGESGRACARVNSQVPKMKKMPAIGATRIPCDMNLIPYIFNSYVQPPWPSTIVM